MQKQINQISEKNNAMFTKLNESIILLQQKLSTSNSSYSQFKTNVTSSILDVEKTWKKYIDLSDQIKQEYTEIKNVQVNQSQQKSELESLKKQIQGMQIQQLQDQKDRQQKIEEAAKKDQIGEKLASLLTLENLVLICATIIINLIILRVFYFHSQQIHNQMTENVATTKIQTFVSQKGSSDQQKIPYQSLELEDNLKKQKNDVQQPASLI
eukprot:TRINITY_DN7470_c0_g1_i2.p1 TRINITY_DN7470_c0_g1~~TRINITY_DN7470_c0_g1_i2.p1  ORF type:complete len:211 (-),score=45.21 TRINITY_DN7470_c0_g1_i2:132-764(-)